MATGGSASAASAEDPSVASAHLRHPDTECLRLQDVLKRGTDIVHNDNRDAAMEDRLLKTRRPSITYEEEEPVISNTLANGQGQGCIMLSSITSMYGQCEQFSACGSQRGSQVMISRTRQSQAEE